MTDLDTEFDDRIRTELHRQIANSPEAPDLDTILDIPVSLRSMEHDPQRPRRSRDVASGVGIGIAACLILFTAVILNRKSGQQITTSPASGNTAPMVTIGTTTQPSLSTESTTSDPEGPSQGPTFLDGEAATVPTTASPSDLTTLPPPATAVANHSLPEMFDLTTVTPLYASDTQDIIAAVDAYFDRAFDIPPVVGLASADEHMTESSIYILMDETVRDASGISRVRWYQPQIGYGTVYLRQAATGWDIVAMESDLLRFETLTRDSGSLQANATTEDINTLVVDVFDLNRTPVPGSARPLGMNPGGDYILGSADNPIELPISGDPVHVRAATVGGRVLLITEIIVD